MLILAYTAYLWDAISPFTLTENTALRMFYELLMEVFWMYGWIAYSFTRTYIRNRS